jgi:hypothetical protein
MLTGAGRMLTFSRLFLKGTAEVCMPDVLEFGVF